MLLNDMPIIQSIDVNHHTESAVNASSLEECNFQKIVQIHTLSDSEVQIRIPAGQIRNIQPNILNKNHHHDRLYFDWCWSTTGRPYSWIVIHLRHGQLRQRETTVWWIRRRTTITYRKYYFMPLSLRPQNSIFSYWRSHTHCENNQWTLQGSDLESTVALEPRTSTQCWAYHTNPKQCSDHENHTCCTPTLGRLEKVLLQSLAYETGGRGERPPPPGLKNSGQTLFSGQAQVAQKSWKIKNISKQWKISGKILFFRTSAGCSKFWMIKNIYPIQWIQGTLCFSEKAKVAQTSWM